MAELPAEDAARLMTAFASAYNRQHRTDFAFDTVATQTNAQAPRSNRDLSVDYVCSSPTRADRVLVQHTEAWTYSTSERFWTRHVGLVRKGLEDRLSTLAGGPYKVSLSIARAPASPKDARQLVHALEAEVRVKITALGAERRTQWTPSGPVHHYVSEIGLWRLDRRFTKSSVFAVDAIAHLDPVEERTQRAIEHKSLRYGRSGKDLVLVVHYRVTSYDEEDLPSIVEAVKSMPHPFREIWVYNDWWIDEPQVHRVWSAPSGR